MFLFFQNTFLTFNNINLIFFLQSIYFLSLIFLILSAMFNEFGEKRILAFFIYFELCHLLCIFLLFIWITSFGINFTEFMIVALFIIGASGAETGIALSLFMQYYKLTGKTTLNNIK